MLFLLEFTHGADGIGRAGGPESFTHGGLNVSLSAPLEAGAPFPFLFPLMPGMVLAPEKDTGSGYEKKRNPFNH